MQVIRLDTYGHIEVIDVPNELKALQQEVGGYIEIVHLSSGIALIIDENGKYKKKPQINGNATRLAHMTQRISPDDHIVGQALVVGIKDEDLTGLDDTQIKNLREVLR